LDKIWISEDPTSTTYTPPITVTAISFPVRRPMTASAAPSEREPTSPSQSRALYILKYKKAPTDPSKIAINMARKSFNKAF